MWFGTEKWLYFLFSPKGIPGILKDSSGSSTQKTAVADIPALGECSFHTWEMLLPLLSIHRSRSSESLLWSLVILCTDFNSSSEQHLVSGSLFFTPSLSCMLQLLRNDTKPSLPWYPFRDEEYAHTSPLIAGSLFPDWFSMMEQLSESWATFRGDPCGILGDPCGMMHTSWTLSSSSMSVLLLSSSMSSSWSLERNKLLRLPLSSRLPSPLLVEGSIWTVQVGGAELVSSSLSSRVWRDCSDTERCFQLTMAEPDEISDSMIGERRGAGEGLR